MTTEADRQRAENAMAMFRAGELAAETHRCNAALRRALRELADAVAPMTRTTDDEGSPIITVHPSFWDINHFHPEAPDGVEVHRDIVEAWRRAGEVLAGPDGETT